MKWIAALLMVTAAFGFARFGAAAEPVSVLSFEEAINAILSRSTVIASQEANLGSVRALNLPIRLAFVPSLSFDAKQTTTGGAAVHPAFNTSQLEGVAQLNLFRWGADYKNWQAASLDEASQQALLQDAYLRTEDGAVSALVAFIQRKKEIGVSQNIVKMREESLAIAKQRYDGGYLPLQEMEKVSVDLGNAQAELADAQVASEVATAALKNLLGHARVALDWPWQTRFAALPLEQAVAPAPDDTALARLLANRPDWRAAQAKADAEDARLTRDWRQLGPTLDGQFNYGYYSSGDPAGLSPSASFGAPQWQGALAITLPFFDHLAIYSTARAQAFVKSGAETALEQVRRDARSEWESARQVFLTSLGSAQTRDKTFALSRKLYQDGQSRFKSGRISADDLQLEQRRLFEAELFTVRGWAAVHQAYSQLCKAQGVKLGDCKI